MQTWHTRATIAIKKTMQANPGMDHKELRALCSKNYPFEERTGWAYKAWLRAMREIFGAARKPADKQLVMQADWVGYPKKNETTKRAGI